MWWLCWYNPSLQSWFGICQPGKVAGELVGEASDVGQLLVVHITEPDHKLFFFNFLNITIDKISTFYMQPLMVTMLEREEQNNNNKYSQNKNNNTWLTLLCNSERWQYCEGSLWAETKGTAASLQSRSTPCSPSLCPLGPTTTYFSSEVTFCWQRNTKKELCLHKTPSK